MKNFSSLMESLPSRSIVVSYAKFDPPSIEHQELIEFTKSLALEHKAKHVVFVQSSKNSLLSDTEKLGYLKEFFSDTTFKLVPAASSLEHLLKPLSTTYKKIHLVSSTDTINECQFAANRLMGSVKEVIIESTNEPSADSLSKTLKTLSESGDFNSFKSNMPANIRDVDIRRLMNEMRASLGLDPVREEMKIPHDDLREQYLRGEIFRVDDIIESNGLRYSIVARGSNYLTIIDEMGAVTKKWLHECNVIKAKDKKVFKKAKENMHYKTLAAYKDRLNEEPVVDTTRTDNIGQSILRYKDFKRLFDAMNGVVETPEEQRVQRVESTELNKEDHDDQETDKKNKKGDNENVKILKPTNKVEEDMHSADYTYNPQSGRRHRAHVVTFKNSRHGGQLSRVEQEPIKKKKTEPMVK